MIYGKTEIEGDWFVVGFDVDTMHDFGDADESQECYLLAGPFDDSDTADDVTELVARQRGDA